MTRSLTVGMKASVEAQSGRELLHLIHLGLSGGDVYLSTAPHDATWDGHTWEGIGGAIGFEGVQESPDSKSGMVSIHVSGVDQAILAALLSQNTRGRKVDVYLAHVDTDTGQIVADPIILFAGYMNEGFTVSEKRGDRGEGTVEIKIDAVNRFVFTGKSQGIECNVTSHQQHYSGDTFFRHVPSLMGKPVNWRGTGLRQSTSLGARPDDPFGGPH